MAPVGGTGVKVPSYFDLRWFLLVPAVLAVGFLAWVFVSLSRDRARGRNRHGRGTSKRDNNHMWE